MDNFFNNAKKILDASQTVAKEVAKFKSQQQEKPKKDRDRSRSRSRSKNRDDKPEELTKFQSVDANTMTKLDNETCFSVMKDQIFYYVVYVEGSVAVLKVGDQKYAEGYRDSLNEFKRVARAAYRQNALRKFVEQASSHSDWPEIHIACLLGLEEAVDKICEKDPLLTVNLAEPSGGLLPLHVCVQRSDLHLSRKLLSYGADLRKCDLSTRNCLHYAVKNDLDFVKALYEMKPTQFSEAVDTANSEDETPFHCALKEDTNQIESVIAFLMKCGANSSMVGINITALGVTLTALDALLKNNPNAMIGDPIEPYKTIFHGEFDREYLKVAQHWSPKVVDHPDEDGRTPLYCACARNDLERAIELLSFGASVNLANNLGNTPLHLAVANNSELLVKLLLCFDADFETKNKKGETPIGMKSTAAVSKIFAQLVQSRKESETAPGHDLTDLIRIRQEKTITYQESLEPNIRDSSLRLLSLDGGGIRGLCMIIILQRIERETKSKKIAEYFDWIAGTSTGAILACSLAEGYSTSDCLSFYIRLKDDVFVGNRPHDHKPLEEFLKECFGEKKKMGEVKSGKRVLITTTKSDTNPPKLVLIRSYEMPQLLTLSIPPNEISMWKACRCSSAAPTYFKSVDKKYLDGGLMANNPAPDLLSDVHHLNLKRECEGKEPLRVSCLLSLGTGRLPDTKIDGLDLEVSKETNFGSLFTGVVNTLTTIKNLSNIFVEQLAASNGAVVERSRAWAHSLQIPYFRYTPQLDVECPLDTHSNREIIHLMWMTKLYAESISKSEIQQIVGLIRAD